MMKRTKKNSQQYETIDLDPYSTSLLDQLLQTSHQWKNVQDIVKLTFKAIGDLVHLLGGSMKDVKNLLTTRASKTQLTTGLSLKSNISDLSRAITQLSSAIDSKISFNDLQNILKEYVNRVDINQILINRPIQDINPRRYNDIESTQIVILQARMDDFQRQITKKVASCVTLMEFRDLLSIVQQKANVSQINQVLQSKVSKQYLSTCLQKKINKSDLEQAMIKKADTTDVQFILNSLESKIGLNTFQKLTQVIENKADRSDLALLYNQKQFKAFQQQLQKQNIAQQLLQQQIKQLKQQLQGIKSTITTQQNTLKKQFQTNIKILTDNIGTFNNFKIICDQQQNKIKNTIRNIQQQYVYKNKNQNFIKQLTNQINIRRKSQQKLYQQIDSVRRRAQEISGSFLQKKQFIDFKSQIIGIIQEKVQAQQVQTALNKWELQINQKLANDKQQLISLLRSVQKILSDGIASNSTDIMNINNILTKKQEKSQSQMLEEFIKKTRKRLEECRNAVDNINSEVQNKISISEYQRDLLQFRKRFDDLHRQLGLKANIKDVCVLADSKPNIDDVNKALRQLNTALSDKISQNDLQSILKDQASINETLCSENIVGRWLWQSGDLKPGGLIPWEQQCANSVPDHFYWQKDKTSILVLAAGIYLITACIFSQSSTPNILINGQHIVQKIEQSQLLRKSKKKKQKDLSGVKIEEYVMIPSRSRISISSNVQGSQGFLNIKRL